MFVHSFGYFNFYKSKKTSRWILTTLINLNPLELPLPVLHNHSPITALRCYPAVSRAQWMRCAAAHAHYRRALKEKGTSFIGWNIRYFRYGNLISRLPLSPLYLRGIHGETECYKCKQRYRRGRIWSRNAGRRSDCAKSNDAYPSSRSAEPYSKRRMPMYTPMWRHLGRPCIPRASWICIT